MTLFYLTEKSLKKLFCLITMLGKVKKKQYIINAYKIEERKNLELKLSKDLFVKQQSNTS